MLLSLNLNIIMNFSMGHGAYLAICDGIPRLLCCVICKIFTNFHLLNLSHCSFLEKFNSEKYAVTHV